jgi:hypothetical protein
MEGVIAWDVLTAPASGRTSQNAQVVYDSLRQRILVIPHNSAISYYYDVVSDSWDDVPTDLRPGGAAFHVSWYDPINGIIAGIATGETLELYRFNWTLRTFSPFATIEVPGLDYITFDGGFVRLKADARLTTGNNTLVILGTATTNSSAGGQTISNRWWSLQVGEITGTPNTADGWLIFLLDLFGFTDIGRTIAALGGLIVIGFILRLAGAHFLVSAPIMVFAVTGFTLIEFLPPWIIVTGAMLGGIALTIVLASGLGRNGGDDE